VNFAVPADGAWVGAGGGLLHVLVGYVRLIDNTDMQTCALPTSSCYHATLLAVHDSDSVTLCKTTHSINSLPLTRKCCLFTSAGWFSLLTVLRKVDNVHEFLGRVIRPYIWLAV